MLRLQSGRSTRNAAWALAALAVLVTLAHLLVTSAIGNAMHEAANEPAIKKIKTTFVTEMRLTKPPVVRAATAPPPPGAAAPAQAQAKKAKEVASAASAASEPEDAASAPQVAEAPASAASAPEVVAQAPSEPSPPKAASSPASGATASRPAGQLMPGTNNVAEQNNSNAPTFVWPKAVRVNYKMQGNFRGPIYGQASVEWLRAENRYQVFVEASVGPSFAPLGSWQLSSEGEIRPEGLYPRRYENLNRLLTRSSPIQSLLLEDEEITLANGNKVPRLPGVQDPASQFIHLAYMFMMKPALLMPGNTVIMNMVWLKKAEALAYDVLADENLPTPMGVLPTVHVRPRRLEGDANNMSAEIWFAPSLQYLPVRILTRANEKTYMDMQMSRPPMQAAESPSNGGTEGLSPMQKLPQAQDAR